MYSSEYKLLGSYTSYLDVNFATDHTAMKAPVLV